MMAPMVSRRPNILQVILLPGQANDESKMQKRKEKTRDSSWGQIL